MSMHTSSSISSTALAEETNRLRADFLRIDAQLALTFSGIALSTADLAKRERTIKIARKAYDTVLRLKPGVRMTHDTEERLSDPHLSDGPPLRSSKASLEQR